MSTTSEFLSVAVAGNGTLEVVSDPENTSVTTTTRSPASEDLTSSGLTTLLSIVIQIVLFFIIIFGNSLVIHAVRRARHLQTRTNYFIVQLAIADILVAVVFPFHIALFLRRDLMDNIHICMLRYTTVLATVTLSVLCLMCMTYDRLLALLHPIHYHLKMTKTKFRIMSVTTWFLAFGFGFLPSFWYENVPGFNNKLCDYIVIVKVEYLQIIQIPCFFSLAIIIMGMYSKIFYIAYKNKARNIQRKRQQSNTNLPGNVREAKQKEGFAITKTCAIVMGTFFVCWLPFQLSVAYQTYTGVADNETLINLRTVFTFVAMSNSAMNPIIYAAR